jgi:NAD-dependent SIR2 family protein deacetylase
MNQNIKQAKRLVSGADAIIITAGAGIGVDSGLPDFRGSSGFWEAYPPLKRLKLDFQQMANPRWFTTNPSLAWAFYGHRLQLYRDTIPHDGFRLLLELVKKKNKNYFIYTSNVDGQFQKASFSEDKIVEAHGSIHHTQCTKCDSGIKSAKGIKVAVDLESFKADTIPLCKSCGATIRPNICMFDDMSWDESRVEIQQVRFDRWLNKCKSDKKNILMIELGAGKKIPHIRHTGERLAKSLKTKMLRINPRDFQIHESVGVSLEYGALEGLELLLG